MAWILSSVLGPVCERVIDATIEEYRLVRDVKEEIMNLRRTVAVIKGVLEDAERKKDDRLAIREWLKSLKQVMFDAEDIFDEIATDEALGIDAEDGTSRLSKVCKFITDVDISSSSRTIAHLVKDITKKLDAISKDKDMLGLHVSDDTSGSVFRRPRPDTSSLLPSCEAHIIGRDGEMQKIEELLLEYSTERTVAATSDNYKNVHVISVVGMGGVGKTTLVKHAYNSPVVAEYFQLRMWVCVSNYFDVERITREIMDAAASSSEQKRDEFVDTLNWDVVQNRLKGKLEGNRFLLVLDDVWEENSEMWVRLCTPLMCGGKGSKIIVTTRSQKVANIAKGIPIFLKDLPSEDLWTILQNYAFDGHDPSKYPQYSQLVIVGEKIVDNLKGSPLAARTIGRVLNENLDVRVWTNILSSKAWVSFDSKDGILPILKLSYDHLPGHLKQCFAYCSLFPEDHKFDKDELVQLWMAQQFIVQIRRDFFHVESEGGVYLDKLVHMSLFEKSTSPYSDTYVMHDLIHNLADSVSKDDCLRLEDNRQNGTISETIRHVSIASDTFDLPKIEELCNKYKNMRTLLFLCGCKFQLDSHLDSIFMKLQRLRVLRLSGCGIKELHASIGTLKHLRFLDLSKNGIIKLPDSLCNLHNLQVLNLKDCDEIRALPRNMSALINLRHLFVEYDHIVSGIQGLGKLTALHELDGFDCGRQPMKELADMGMLRRLRIRSLEKVESREEAAGSRLDKKEHLDELTLEWGLPSKITSLEKVKRREEAAGSRLDKKEPLDELMLEWELLRRIFRDDHLIDPGLEEVFDGLQPPSSIRRLTIAGYGGTRSPSWMEEDQSWLRGSSFLRSIELYNCTNWEVLPPLGQLLCLDSLKIRGMTRVRRIGSAFMGCCRQLPQGGFPSLQVLEFNSMEEWEEWEVPLLGTDADDGGEADQLFLARLRELTIKSCPKLRQLPPLPPTLTKLSIDYVGLTHLPEWLPPSSLPSSCSSSPSLSSLVILNCQELTSLAGGLLRHPLPNLVKLEIINCRGLVSLPADTAFGHLTSLKKLVVESCPKLAWASTCESPSVEDSGLPPSLESITIQGGCGEVMDQMMLAIVSSGQKLACLRKLHVLGPRMERSRDFYGNMRVSSTWHRCPVSIETCPAVTPPPPPTLRRSLPSSLQELTICDMDQLDDETLSAWLRGLTSLRQLRIEDCPAVTSLPRAEVLSHLTALEKLEIKRLKALSSFGGGIQCLVSLEGCFSRPPSTTLRRSLPSSLQELTICDIDQLDDETLSAWLRGLTSLRRLSISGCPAVTSLPRAELLSHLTALKKLEIKRLNALSSFGGGIHCLVSLEELSIEDCPELLDIITTAAADSSRPSSSSALPSPARSSVGTTSTTRIRTLVISGSSMQQIKTWLLLCPSLQELHIRDCPQLTGFGGNNDGGDDVGGGDLLEAALLNLSGTLQRLEFRWCNNLRSLPPRLRCLSSLQSLRIVYCPQIRSLPVAGLPESLQDLHIYPCHPELAERCKEGVGSDWPLISHIPGDGRYIR